MASKGDILKLTGEQECVCWEVNSQSLEGIAKDGERGVVCGVAESPAQDSRGKATWEWRLL